MKDEKPQKYPGEMFLFGILMNFFARFYIWMPALILSLAGGLSHNRPCQYIGLGLFLGLIAFSIIEQLAIKMMMEKKSDDPEFERYRSEIMDGNRRRKPDDDANEKKPPDSDEENKT